MHVGQQRREQIMHTQKKTTCILHGHDWYNISATDYFPQIKIKNWTHLYLTDYDETSCSYLLTILNESSIDIFNKIRDRFGHYYNRIVFIWLITPGCGGLTPCKIEEVRKSVFFSFFLHLLSYTSYSSNLFSRYVIT